MTTPLFTLIRLSAIACVLLTTTLGCNSSADKQPDADTKTDEAASTDTEEPEAKAEAAAEEPATLDHTNAAAVAKAALTAYKNKDLAALAEVSTPWNQEMFVELAAKGAEHPRYQSIFRGSRWEAVEAWDGEKIDAREKDPKTVVVDFLTDDEDERKVAVLELDEDGHWGFEDINFWEAERFNALEKVE